MNILIRLSSDSWPKFDTDHAKRQLALACERLLDDPIAHALRGFGLGKGIGFLTNLKNAL